MKTTVERMILRAKTKLEFLGLVSEWHVKNITTSSDRAPMGVAIARDPVL
jgi:hypothetical protein